ncbi:hypothetical protein [Amycolatopsis sp. lyj-109]
MIVNELVLCAHPDDRFGAVLRSGALIIPVADDDPRPAVVREGEP